MWLLRWTCFFSWLDFSPLSFFILVVPLQIQKMYTRISVGFGLFHCVLRESGERRDNGRVAGTPRTNLTSVMDDQMPSKARVTNHWTQSAFFFSTLIEQFDKDVPSPPYKARVTGRCYLHLPCCHSCHQRSLTKFYQTHRPWPLAREWMDITRSPETLQKYLSSSDSH